MDSYSNPRLMRLRERIMACQFTCEWTKGSLNLFADALSRFLSSKPAKVDTRLGCDLERDIGAITPAQAAELDPGPEDSILLELKTAYAIDPTAHYQASPPVDFHPTILMGHQRSRHFSYFALLVVIFSALVQKSTQEPARRDHVSAEWLNQWLEQGSPSNSMDEQALTRLFKRGGSAIRLMRRAPLGGSLRYGKRFNGQGFEKEADEAVAMPHYVRDYPENNPNGEEMMRLVRANPPSSMVRLMRSNMVRLLKRDQE
eukprot:maker-scaffold1161_size58349-snap-gene-0.9 protein:Tk11135 transcript:maker-scaffold1161_size58349-snap-gene-0.9-mRNA-1 annotation:"PREDICTED: uncharacterized protein LOC100197465"